MKPTSNSTLEQLVAMFDVTLLTPSATERDIVDLCTAVSGQGFKRICVNPSYVSRAVQALRGTGVRVVTVIGFPLGATPTECKCFEAERALSDGAAELDMVLNLGAHCSGDLFLAEKDVYAVVETAKGAPVKVIIETPLLNRSQKVTACRLAQNAGASFIKTCTGFSQDPIALFEDVRLIRETVGPHMGIKASGRVGNLLRAQAMIEAGATRIGLLMAQATAILTEWDEAQHINSH